MLAACASWQQVRKDIHFDPENTTQKSVRPQHLQLGMWQNWRRAEWLSEMDRPHLYITISMSVYTYYVWYILVNYLKQWYNIHKNTDFDFDTYPDKLLCHMYMVDTTTIRDLCFCCTGSGVSRIRSRNACHGARCHPEQSSGWSAPGSTLPISHGRSNENSG